MTDGEEIDEHEMLRRAMVNTMRLFSAEQFGSDKELFRQTVMQTLEVVRERTPARQQKQRGTTLKYTNTTET